MSGRAPGRSLSAIVLASNNRGKLLELSQILAAFRVTLFPLSHFSSESPEESGSSFRENALIKARFAAQASQLPAIADDSGLEVDVLNGAPGVYSARYAGLKASDKDNNEKLLTALSGVPEVQRTARFRCVLAYVDDADDSQPIIAEGLWDGRILATARGAEGFGYDPLFEPLGEIRSAAELSIEEKNCVSHRAQALRLLADRLFATDRAANTVTK